MVSSPRPLPNQLAALLASELARRDIFGRNILHLLVLFDKPDLLKNLLKNPNVTTAFLLSLDEENRWNVLHYCIAHVRLSALKQVIKKAQGTRNTLESLLSAKDGDGTTPMELLDTDWVGWKSVPTRISSSIQLQPRFKSPDGTSIRRRGRSKREWFRGGTDFFVFGLNKNSNLGLGNADDRAVPVLVNHQDFKTSHDLSNAPHISSTSSSHSLSAKFSRPRFSDVKMSQKFSVVLTTVGTVFTAGAPSRGRLGNGDSQVPQFSFAPVKFFTKPVSAVEISDDHCVALSQGEIYAWGSNSHAQLGYLEPNRSEHSSEPRRVISGDIKKEAGFIGVAASNVHSVAYTKNAIYSWGLNSGQMGIPLEYTQKHRAIQGPKRMDFKYGEIKSVVVTPDLMLVLTPFDVHLYSHFSHQRLAIPCATNIDKTFHIFKPGRLTARREIAKIAAHSSHVYVLFSDGDILSFNMVKTRFHTVWKSKNDHRRVVDMACSGDGGLILCTQDGATWLRHPQLTKFTKLAVVNNVVRVFCDPQFVSFGCLREDWGVLPVEVSQSDFSNDFSYLSPLHGFDPERILTRGPVTDTYTDFVGEANGAEVEDQLYAMRGPKQRPEKTFRKVDEGAREALLSDEAYLRWFYQSSGFSAKGYDCWFAIDGVRVGVHRWVMEARVPNIVELEAVGYDPATRTFNLGTVKLLSLLVLIHFIYTDQILAVWDDLERNGVKAEFYRIAERFGLVDRVGRVRLELSFPQAIQRLMERSMGESTESEFPEGPNAGPDTFSALSEPRGSKAVVKILLLDGHRACFAPLLAARCLYFETLLNRWSSRDILLSHISTQQFDVILRHIHGHDPFTLFDHLAPQFSGSHDCINFLLELTDVADELMLGELKDICQLTVKDYITLENVTLVFKYSVDLQAEKLMLECLWYIYNNAEVLIMDDHFLLELNGELLGLVERSIGQLRRGLANGEAYSIDLLVKPGVDDGLIQNFLTDIRAFNLHYITNDHNYSFVPVAAVSVVTKGASKPKNRRRSSNRGSVSMPVKPVVVRKPSVSQPDHFSPTFEDDVPTESRRDSMRKSVSPPLGASFASVKSPPGINGQVWGYTPETSVNIPSGTSEKAWGRVPAPEWPPVLGALPTPTPSPVPIKPKASSTPRLSQKERLKNKKNVSEVTPELIPATNPWSRKPSSTSVTPSPVTTPRGASPVLRKASWGPSSSLSSNQNFPSLASPAGTLTPSLTEIILQEQDKVERLQQKPTKTLAEIQEEEAFNRWFEEESRRVQQELDAVNQLVTGPDKNRKPKKKAIKANGKTRRVSSL
ncbi:hypothetical protein BABINDRAFT_163878 [Babjeviella inositovora NRRL Y-12698]|uniref:BTB domain-containing protein n=1 Tax=Babjeviella inositovora NRRL Y-12698 TaxID=984486 RepID=A0A1E3QIT1_9ASCO|nr:uncharacterized protein BABINDRAFT_163878 [Babjeviella inositovora NRRL Y-12698]ODQ76972.1 hypothetical protein BABINDRAFT_163878 [Babjeviella inositovora NRRL Y-12698]